MLKWVIDSDSSMFAFGVFLTQVVRQPHLNGLKIHGTRAHANSLALNGKDPSRLK